MLRYEPKFMAGTCNRWAVIVRGTEAIVCLVANKTEAIMACQHLNTAARRNKPEPILARLSLYK